MEARAPRVISVKGCYLFLFLCFMIAGQFYGGDGGLLCCFLCKFGLLVSTFLCCVDFKLYFIVVVFTARFAYLTLYARGSILLTHDTAHILNII